MKLINELTKEFIYSKNHESETDMHIWREKICNTVYYFFSILGLFTFIPSFILSIQEEYYGIAAASTFIYLICIIFTVNKKINYYIRAVTGLIIFFMVGLIMVIFLGPKGAGEIWMFSTTILASLVIGNRGALVGLFVNTLILLFIYILLKTEVLIWIDRYEISAAVWAVRAINLILVNLIIVIGLAIFIRGFRTIISRSEETRNASIIGLAKLAENRDSDTGSHLKRIQYYSVILAEGLSRTPKFKNYISPEYIKDLYISSILHDIGKVGIPDAILLKPGKLTDEEFEKIKKHTLIGADVIQEIEKNIRGRSFYTLGKEIALSHHEKWDGSGYPEGLQGEQIPLSARIVAIADVYDALTSKRSYKLEVSHEEAMDIINKSRGSHFDPEIVEVFVKLSSEIQNRMVFYPEEKNSSSEMTEPS